MTMTATQASVGFGSGLQVPEVKARLAEVVRGQRAALVKAIGDAAESTWRLSLAVDRAGLAEGPRRERERLENALKTQVDAALASATGDGSGRAGGRGDAGDRKDARAKETAENARKRLLTGLVTRAAATFFNRVAALRQLEALHLSRPAVVTGGFQSAGWRDFREYAPALLDDENGAYALLLRLLFDERAVDLPGLFGDAGETEWFRVPAHAVREAVEALDDSLLAEAWTDGTLLGWIYQFWNDPDREKLDEKLREHGKLENHEIAAKTQLFTDRYIVEWMLQNALGAIWFEICANNGWTPDVVAHGTLDRLEARRADWRGKRERGEVGLEDLMPVDPGEEDRWKYWVVREQPPDAVGFARDSIRDVKLLDPACGSGHFLVIAFDLLAALYEEEARHRGETWTREHIAASIIENNLHGIDIDPRAVQIAAAALMIGAKVYAPGVMPTRVNLVASNLGLASLPDNDPALRALFAAVEQETGIPESLTRTIVDALKGADHLGSLLKVDAAVGEAITQHDGTFSKLGKGQGHLWDGFARVDVSADEARGSILASLDNFLKAHTSADDLGLRTGAAQLAAGVRFIRVLGAEQYDLVIGNPPYQGTGKMADAEYYAKHYPEGKADLSVAFIMRALKWCRPGGRTLLLTIRGWMFSAIFERFRDLLADTAAIEIIGDFDQGAFSNEVGNLLTVSAVTLRPGGSQDRAIAMLPTPFDVRWRNDNRRAFRKSSALLGAEGRYEFRPSLLAAIEGRPLIYWWTEDFLERLYMAPKLGSLAPARKGLWTGNDFRFLRSPWELSVGQLLLSLGDGSAVQVDSWVPYIKGAEGKAWFEPVSFSLKWAHHGLEVKAFEKDGRQASGTSNEGLYFNRGVAFSMIGVQFTGRIHRMASVFGNKGSSVFSSDLAAIVCLLNSSTSREVLASFNPGVGFEVGDVNRLPVFPIESADAIVATLDTAFTEHEAAREPSVEFRRPGPSPWRAAQEWAQRAVDRPAGEPLPPYVAEYDREPATDHLSFALGVALGRLDAFGRGVLDPTTLHPLPPVVPASPAGVFPPEDATSSLPPPASPQALPAAAEAARIAAILPHGILFLSACNESDSLSHPAARVLHEAWEKHGARIGPNSDLRTYLREKLFPDVHRKMYENRPIYFPLLSAKRTFVAWVSIHRFDDSTLLTLLADHLEPEMTRLEGDIVAVLESSKGGRLAGRDENRLAQLQKWRDELRAFIDLVYQCAERGAPPAEPRDPKREVDARLRLDLDDGVMINSAALWPLLEPQWKDPRKWWGELSRADGKKDYDWAHLAARYWPARVDGKCQRDPSLAVAHGCFWRYHPEKAFQWEQRLKLEIGPHFTLDEPDAAVHRAAFEAAYPDRCAAIIDAEQRRHARRSARTGDADAAAGGDPDVPATATTRPRSTQGTLFD